LKVEQEEREGGKNINNILGIFGCPTLSHKNAFNSQTLLFIYPIHAPFITAVKFTIDSTAT